MKAYLDNNATTKVDKTILKEVNKINNTHYANTSSIHKAGEEAKEILEQARTTIAKKLNANHSEIIFTSGGSESNNLAFRGLADANKNKKHIIISSIEHPSVLETAKRMNLELTIIPVDKEGKVKLDKLKQAVRKDTLVVSIIHSNNEIGVIQDIKAIGKICKEKKVFFHTDIVQSFGKEEIDVKECNINLASISGHKINGIKGIGALYKNVRISKRLQGGEQEMNLRAGTVNLAGAHSLALASNLLKKSDITRMKKLRDYLTTKILKEIPDSTLNGPKERASNTSNIRFRYVEGESVLTLLSEKGIYVSTGSACSSNSLEPSHVLTAMGIPHEHAHGAIRFSLSKDTTKEEIDYTIKHLKEIISKLRRISSLK
jgi:cysteine desulfurase